MTERLRVNEERLWASLMDMARIGATPKGGSRRLALTDEDKQGRELFVRWCRAAGCSITVDSMGNIFARRPGTDRNRAPVASGSHLDTQPHGGRFDGVYGVLAALEVLRTLNDAGVETRAPLEAIVWSNEEGARFAPAMLASGVFAGVYTSEYAMSRTDRDGRTFGAELARIGYAGDVACGGHALEAFFEAHIEQGPILEAEGKTIGVVTGVQGLYWFDVTVTGQDSHAGSTPMERRRDALLGAARMVAAVHDIALEQAPQGRATVGELYVSPGSRNTIPGMVRFGVDIRHPDAAALKTMGERLSEQCTAIGARAGLEVSVERIDYTPPVSFDGDCIDAVESACERLHYPHRRMQSGAGHDACFVSMVAPTSMIFVPCADGLSHNELESAQPDDLAAGGNVLLHALLGKAGVG